jgi:hypothetical protein
MEMTTTNIQEIKEQIWSLMQQLKDLSTKCELLSTGQIGESVKSKYQCLHCYDTKQLHLEGSGWMDAPCRHCCD